MKRLKFGSAPREKLFEVAKKVSAWLTELGIDHALIGGLAVGVYGFDRATKDVDFLVDEQGRDLIGGRSLGAVRGVADHIDGVDVDFLFGSDEMLQKGVFIGTVPVIPQVGLVVLKLRAGRRKDQMDIIELVKRGGLNVTKIRDGLQEIDQQLVEEFDSFVAEAELEAD